MKVAQVNNPLASTHGQPAEEPSNRADAFARVLQTAVFGRGSEAVAKTTERAMAAAAPRTETRPVERRERAEPAATRPDTTPAPRKDTVRDTDTRDTAAAQKPNESKAPARTEAKPAKDAAEKSTTEQTEKAPDDTAAAAPPQDAAAQPVDQTAEQPEAQDAAGDTAEETLPEDAGKPVVADAPDAALILALLQTTTIAAPAADAAAVTTVPTVSVLSPEEAAAAALAAAAEAQAKAATPVQTDAAADAESVDAKAAAPVVAQPTLPAGAADPQIKTATDTSAAALLSQQQTVSAEDFATLQQALTAQNQGQVQVQDQAGKPAVTAEAKQKAEPKADKIITVDVQTVTATPKTLVDQAALFAMQDDDQAAADMAQLQQQTQAALQQQSQPTTSELKFNAALLQAAADDVAVQAGSTASSNSGTSSQQSAAIGATAATQATQATHQAATQTAARHLNAYVPVGEQVGVQIKKGVAEGLDKISIKLDPGNLGKVEIKLEIGHDGRLQAVIAADKPETLQLLQQDVKNLEQSLRDAGLKTDQQSLSFTLRDQSQANEGRDGNGAGNGRHQNRGGSEYAETGANTDPAQLAAANAQRAAAARGGLDIRI